MKLVIITAISEFKKDIIKMFKNTEIKTFTYKEVTGFKDVSEENVGTNWFGSEMNETPSIMFYAFLNENQTALLFQSVTSFNASQKVSTKIHFASLTIDQINN